MTTESLPIADDNFPMRDEQFPTPTSASNDVFTTPDVTRVDPSAGEDSEDDKPRKLTPTERVRGAARRRGARGIGGASAASPGERDSARRSRADKPVPPKPKPGSLTKPLTEMYMGVGLMLAPIDPACSTAFIQNAEQCAKSMENLARENETVRRAILALTQTSAWGGVIIAHLPILLVITAHHGPEATRERIAPLAMMMGPATTEAFTQAEEDSSDE